MRVIVSLLISYLAAVPLTSKISMDLAQTEWTNIWTYVIWFFAFTIWIAIILGFFLIVAWWSDR